MTVYSTISEAVIENLAVCVAHVLYIMLPVAFPDFGWTVLILCLFFLNLLLTFVIPVIVILGQNNPGFSFEDYRVISVLGCKDCDLSFFA